MDKKFRYLLIILVCILILNVIAVPNIYAYNIDNAVKAITDHGSEQVENEASKIYIVSRENLTISRILPNTTIEEFKNKFSSDQGTIQVYDKEGKKEKVDGYIGTGMQVKFDKDEGTYIVSVIGDITGNGKIEQIEVNKAIKHVINLEDQQITGVQAISADVSGNGKIDQEDIDILIKYVVTGKLKIGELSTPETPTINITSGTEGKNGWYISGITFEVEKPSESEVPITNMIVEVSDGLTKKTKSLPEGGNIDIEEEGIYEIKAYSISAVGVKSLEKKKTIKIDKTAPISAELTGKFKDENGANYEFNTSSPQNIYLETTAGEDNLSEIESVTIEATGANIIPEGTKAPATIQNEGTTDVTVTTINKAGLSTEKTYKVLIDKKIKGPGRVITKIDDENGEGYIGGIWTNHNIYLEVEQGTEGIKTSYKVEGENKISKTSEPSTLTKEGISTITVINEDAYGNVSESTIIVKIDKQAPDMPTYKVTSGEKINEGSQWYTNDVTLKVLQGTRDVGNSGIEYTTYQVSGKAEIEETEIEDEGTISFEEEGIYNVTLYNYDVAGNRSEANTFDIKIDKTNPTAGTMILKKGDQDGEEYENDTWTNQNVYIELQNGTDTLDGELTSVYKISGVINTKELTEPNTIIKDGVHTITVITTDASGREATREYTVKMDRQAPDMPTYKVTSGEKTSEENEWYSSDVTLKVLQGTRDAGNSGIAYTTYQVSGKAEIEETEIEDEGTISFEEEGIYNVTLYNYDVAGNRSEANTFDIKVDKTNPTAGTMILKKGNQDGEEYENNTWTNQNVYIELQNGTDTLDEEITSVYKISGVINTDELTEPNTIIKDGVHTITVITTDASGREATREYTVKIDKQVPDMPIYEVTSGDKTSEENEWYNSDVTLKVLQGTRDAGNSGIAYTTYQVSGKVEIEETEIEDEGTISFEEEGIYNVTLYNYDVAGNRSEANTFDIKVDKVAPQNIVIDPKEITGTDIHTVISATEEMSGIVLYQVYVDEILYKEIETSEKQVNCDITGRSSGKHIILVKIKDLAGNENESSIEVNMGRLVESDIEHVEFVITGFTKEKDGLSVTSGSEYIVSDTSVSEKAKYMQVSTSAEQTIGELTGSIRIKRKDGTLVDAFEYYPESLIISIEQHSGGSGTSWSHEANVNVANTVLNNSSETSENETVAILEKQNSDNTFMVKDKKISGTKTYTRLIITEITADGLKIPFKIINNIS